VKAEDNHRQGHRQRLRDKFLSSGLTGFHDYEVIELLLTLATPRKDCKTPAKATLEKFKSLPGVLEAATADLCAIEGIGPTNVFGIKLVKAVADRCLEQKLEGGTPLDNSGDLYNYLRLTMRHKSREVFKAVFLDAKNRIIASETLFTGTLTASAVYPREVVAAALRHHAAAVIFAHNHPSGDPQPSEEDVAITRRLVQACAVMDITVHEHLIVGGNGYFSFADQGYMAAIRRDIESQDGGLP